MFRETWEERRGTRWKNPKLSQRVRMQDAGLAWDKRSLQPSWWVSESKQQRIAVSALGLLFRGLVLTIDHLFLLACPSFLHLLCALCPHLHFVTVPFLHLRTQGGCYLISPDRNKQRSDLLHLWLSLLFFFFRQAVDNWLQKGRKYSRCLLRQILFRHCCHCFPSLLGYRIIMAWSA